MTFSASTGLVALGERHGVSASVVASGGFYIKGVGAATT